MDRRTHQVEVGSAALPVEGLAEPWNGLTVRGLIESPDALLKEGSYS